MISGTIRQTGPEAWIVEHSYSAQSEPVLITVSWRVTGARRTGPFAPALADGTRVDSIAGRDAWQAYREGDYLTVETEHSGTIREIPYPCPKVRAGIETRYRYGQWEKNTKAKGWVAA